MSNIFFRQVEEPYPKGFNFWHVEYYPEITPLFPVGLVVVCTYGGAAQLNFIFVADQWRQQGIGQKMVTACLERWPMLMRTQAMDEIADRLFKKFPEFDKDEEDYT
jgi:GNAT superfamily N-acetyltransferase